MSATTTTAPAPAIIPEESDEEIMREWDGVRHWDKGGVRLKPGATFIALCGEKVTCCGQFNADKDVLPKECPICRALNDALKP